jgi:hypothetical protein
VRNGSEHIMKAHLEALKLGHLQLHLHVSYAAPGADDTLGRDYQNQGRLDIALLRRILPPMNTSLLRKEVLPLLALFASLIAAAAIVDLVLHLLGLV